MPGIRSKVQEAPRDRHRGDTETGGWAESRFKVRAPLPRPWCQAGAGSAVEVEKLTLRIGYAGNSNLGPPDPTRGRNEELCWKQGVNECPSTEEWGSQPFLQLSPRRPTIYLTIIPPPPPRHPCIYTPIITGFLSRDPDWAKNQHWEIFIFRVLRRKCSTGFPIRQLYTLDISRVLLPWQRQTKTDTKGKIQTQKMPGTEDDYWKHPKKEKIIYHSDKNRMHSEMNRKWERVRGNWKQDGRRVR